MNNPKPIAFDKSLADAEDALAFIRKHGAPRTELVSEGPRTYEREVPRACAPATGQQVEDNVVALTRTLREVRAQLAAAEGRVELLQTELESHANQEVSWKMQLAERNERIALLRGLVERWVLQHGDPGGDPCGVASALVGESRKAIR
jgi:hypothetical protein